MLSGGLAGGALAVRPNLLPLAGVVALWLAISNAPSSARTAVRTLAAFGVAFLPGVLFVMTIQNAMHGSPFRSGYGDLSLLFSAGHLAPNLARYPRWLVEAHTPLILVALVSPLLARGAFTRRYCRLAPHLCGRGVRLLPSLRRLRRVVVSAVRAAGDSSP